MKKKKIKNKNHNREAKETWSDWLHPYTQIIIIKIVSTTWHILIGCRLITLKYSNKKIYNLLFFRIDFIIS